MADPLKMSASELGEAFENNLTNPVEALEAYFEAIKNNALTERIYVEVTKERALGEAEDARKRQKLGLRMGPLDGVPISWKDLFDVAGHETIAGSDLLKGRMPQTDCAILEQASINGLVTLGKNTYVGVSILWFGLEPGYSDASLCK